MTLIAPHESAPEISVVMVTHGAWSFTERAVAMLLAHTDAPFELIVVDNASKDETREQLRHLPSARVLLNDANEGFGAATNQGAAQARGELLLLLNTDAFVRPGWLDPLREALQDRSVGAVIPQYLHPDESLQEAGGLLAQDGSVLVYGDGDDPRHPSYRFRRIVDYGGAACMLVRRDIFASLGGFDPVYSPAYYEDADLGLRIAQAGMSVVYEPRSTVIHARYGSGTAAAAARLSERNRATFRNRWESQLTGRPWTFRGTTRQAIIGARDALATPRVLLAGRGDAPDTHGVIRALMRGWPAGRLTWAPGFARGAGHDFDPDPWLRSGVEVLPGSDWLEDRLFHYDVVMLGDGVRGGLATALTKTQPQAAQVELATIGSSADPLAGLVPAMALSGIAPPARS